MLFVFFKRRDPENMGNERRKGNMIIKYANYIFFILILILLFFMIYFLTKLEDVSESKPENGIQETSSIQINDFGSKNYPFT